MVRGMSLPLFNTGERDPGTPLDVGMGGPQESVSTLWIRGKSRLAENQTRAVNPVAIPTPAYITYVMEVDYLRICT
jgi:hypothetical protein